MLYSEDCFLESITDEQERKKESEKSWNETFRWSITSEIKNEREIKLKKVSHQILISDKRENFLIFTAVSLGIEAMNLSGVKIGNCVWNTRDFPSIDLKWTKASKTMEEQCSNICS